MYNQYIPLVRVKLKKHQPRKSWITQGLIKSIKVKNKLYSKFLQINPNKSPGPDCLDPSVVKQTAKPLAPTLSYIFNIAMESGRVPDQPKIAKVLPIFKADDNRKFSNYRPISILPIFSKILERVVYVRLNEISD